MRTYVKIAIVVFLLSGINCYAQKKNGIVYSEHETIEKTRDLWKAFEAGDADMFLSFMADSVRVFVNGKFIETTRESTIEYVNYYRDNYEDVSVKDHKPAYPDAIKYKESGVWVQDWMKLTGLHKETGIMLDLPVHHLYQFNKDGKIASMHYYMDVEIFKEIRRSKRIIENGTVYINHPHIVTVRKLVNAFQKKDLDTWKTFFDEKARFGNAAMKHGETIDLETQIAKMKESRFFKPETKFKIEQVGYPDCIYIAKSDTYFVDSWWLYKEKGKDKVIEVPYLLSTQFNKDGKIVREFVWYSHNHFDE